MSGVCLIMSVHANYNNIICMRVCVTASSNIFTIGPFPVLLHH